MNKQRKLKLVHGKIKIRRYKKNSYNKHGQQCVCCGQRFRRYNMLKIAINEAVFYNYQNNRQSAYMCEPCYEIFRTKILSFDNMDEIVRTIELEHQVMELHAKIKQEKAINGVLLQNYNELKDENNQLIKIKAHLYNLIHGKSV